MAIDFPASPTNGQTFTSGSVTYTWDGTKWTAVAAAGSSNSITQGNTNATVTDTGSDGRFVVTTEGSERLRVDSSGRLLVGTSSARSNIDGSNTPQTQFEGVGYPGASFSLTRNSADSGGPVFYLAKTRSSSIGGIAAAQSGDTLGSFVWTGSDGTGTIKAAAIESFVDGTPGTNDMPGRLTFSVTADGASSPTERMRIDSSGRLLVGTSTTAYAALIHAKGSLSDYLLALENTSSGPYGIRIRYSAASPNGASNDFLYCDDSTALRFQVRSNGGLANYSANNVNLSDRNAKKDIALASDTWNCLKEWEIVNFRYKDQPDDSDLNMGVIAQQIAESCPEVITVFQEATEDQPEKLGVKDQQMMWMAIKALQEAQLRIETLEAKVAALESPTTALEIPVDPSSTDT